MLVQDRLLLGLAEGRPVFALSSQFGFQFRDGAGLALAIVGLRIKPGIVDLQENPLRPPVEILIGGGHVAALIVSQTQATQLALHVLNVRHGGGARVGTRLHGVLLRGQAEGVITQRMQDVCPLHAVETRENIRGDITQRVSHVQADAGRVGEHILHEHAIRRQLQTWLREITRGVRSVERALLVPLLLPALLNIGCQLRRVAIGRSGAFGAVRVAGSRVGHG